MEQLHTIGKLELSHYLPAGEYAPAVRETTARICHEQLLPALNKLLDSWTDPGETLRIDRIEIYLRAKDVNQLEQILVEEILKKIKELYDPVSGTTARQLRIEQIPRSKSNFDSWVYFLRNGCVPHTTSLPEEKAWEQEILEIVSTEISAKEACRDVLVSHPHSITRILSQFGKDFIYSWAAAFSGVASKQVTTLVQNWEAVFERKEVRELLYNKSWSLSFLQKQSRQWLIYKIVKQAERQDPAILLEDLAGFCFNKAELPIYFRALEKFLAEHRTRWPVLAEALVSWRKRNVFHQPEIDELQPGPGVDNEDKTKETSFGEEAKEIAEAKDILQAENDLTLIRAQGDETADKIEDLFKKDPGDIKKEEDSSDIKSPDIFPPLTESKDNRVDDNETNEGINLDIPNEETLSDSSGHEEQYENTEPALHYINNAGLVLIYPYLQPLFESQGLLVKNQFKNNLSRDKAVQFLCYLAYGETGLPEYELVLPKLLCGLVPADTVIRFIQLGEEEKEEADSLLKALIAHWKVLKNTSADGLRINFLQREGRLQWKSDEWRLRVTQSTHDILLERLPWGISIIRLPWMKFFLKTEWV